LKNLSNIITDAIKEKTFSGAAVEVMQNGKPVISEYFGTTSFETETEKNEDVTSQHLFDLASLTKPLCTTLLCNTLIDKDIATLNTGVAEIFDQYALNFNKSLETVTIKNLLNHSSGLEAWAPIYKFVKNRSDAYMFVRSRNLEYKTGTKHIYSDLGYIMLGEIIEILMEKRLDHLFELYITEILELHNLKFIPLNIDSDEEKFVSSGYSEIRNKLLAGEVNDENCFALGGVAGHAGLFGTAKDVCCLADHIRECIVGSPIKPLINKSFATTMLEKSKVDSEWANGWHYPSKEKSSGGQLISQNSIGMTGFTGTSVWIDLDKNIVITILTNRTISPTSAKFGGETDKFTDLRPKLHDAILGVIR